jgi:chemotaxis signal transduction protein
MDCFIFEAAGKHLGIDAHYIYRIVDDVEPAPIPLLPACHAGIIYDRGDLFDVIDVGRLLDKESSSSPEKSLYIILLKWNQRKLGLIPKRIIGIKWIQDTADTNTSQTVLTTEGRAIQLITPEEIWKMLSDLLYGH